jgi:GntR family transcriptional regulator, transcriptional repressor for pyruvate dehydrogenase complex
LSNALQKIERVQFNRASDLVFNQLRRMILDGTMPADEPLGPERALAERFGVNRVHVREALQKLEFFGLVKTRRNVGTVVTGSGVRAVEGIFSNVLSLLPAEMAAIAETRDIIESQIVILAVKRATAKDIVALRAAHTAFTEAVAAGEDGLEYDLSFHLAIADAARNPVLRSLTGLMAPDLIQISRSRHSCDARRTQAALREHEAILDAIVRRDPDAAVRAVQAHLRAGAKAQSITPPARASKTTKRPPT